MDLVFLDHSKALYLSEIQRLEARLFVISFDVSLLGLYGDLEKLYDTCNCSQFQNISTYTLCTVISVYIGGVCIWYKR